MKELSGPAGRFNSVGGSCFLAFLIRQIYSKSVTLLMEYLQQIKNQSELKNFKNFMRLQ